MRHSHIPDTFTGKCDRCRQLVTLAHVGRMVQVWCPTCGRHLYGEPFLHAEPEPQRRLVRA